MTEKRRAVFIICFLLASLCGVMAAIAGSEKTDKEILAKKKIFEPWGMNVHLVFPSAKPFMNQLCAAMKDAGVQIIRIDGYWSYGNMLAQRALLDSAMYYADLHGLKVLLNFPTVPTRRDSASVDEWCKMLKYYASRYDGETPIRLTDSGEVRYPKVNYFEPMNEVDFVYDQGKITLEEAFMLTRKSAEAIREARPESDVKVVMAGICSFSQFVKKFLSYKDKDGISLKELVDVVSYHDYTTSADGWMYDIKRRKKEFKEAGLEDKEIWLTEYGSNLYETDFDEQASFFVKRSVEALSLGIDKIFYYQFHYYGGNTFPLKLQREDYFGMVDTGIKNPYVEFLENRDDGEFSIMTKGRPIRVYITGEKRVSLHELNDLILRQLKDSGLKIAGKGFSVVSVVLFQKKTKKESVIWTGKIRVDSDSNQVLKLKPELFKTATKNDCILVYVENVPEKIFGWDELRPFPVYEAYTSLASLLVKEASLPVKLSKENKQYAWSKPDGTNVLAIWDELGEMMLTRAEGVDSGYYIFDDLGRKLKKRNILIRNSPFLFVGKDSLLMRGF